MNRRSPVNLSLPDDLVRNAKRLGVNLSRAAEAGLEQAVARANKPGFRFGALKGVVPEPALDVFAPLSDAEADEWGL